MGVIVWGIVFAAIFAMGYPIALGMFISSAIYLLLEGLDLALLLDNMVISFESNFILLAVPLFIFAAKVMNAGKITDRLFDFAATLVGPYRGALGYVNVIDSIIFAGMTGSQIADVAGLGTIEIKAMKDAGYDGPFSCAVTAASGTIGPIIPPSIPMVIYAMLSGQSVGFLFLGGFLPGFILGALLMVLVYILSRKRNYPIGKRVSWRGFLRSLVRAFPVLMAPVILLGGIYGGVFTPTEAAAIVSVYVLFLCFIVYREFGLRKLYMVLADTVLATGFISFIVASSFIFGYIVAREGIPVLLTRPLMASGLLSHKWAVLLLLNILFLGMGCLLDTTPLLLILVPIILPIVKAAGIDLVHFGVVIVLNLMIGLDTPPYAPTLFITSGVSGTPYSEVVREMLIFLVFEIAALIIITYIPGTVLWLPRLFGYKG